MMFVLASTYQKEPTRPAVFGEALTQSCSHHNLALNKVTQIHTLAHFSWFRHNNFDYWLFTFSLIYHTTWHCSEIINITSPVIGFNGMLWFINVYVNANSVFLCFKRCDAVLVCRKEVQTYRRTRTITCILGYTRWRLQIAININVTYMQ